MEPLTFTRALEYFGTFVGGLDDKQLYEILSLLQAEVQARKDRNEMARMVTDAIELKLTRG